MKLALLKGNRFNPWHLQGFTRLRGSPEITAFRAESEIQRHFTGRDDGSVDFRVERIYFDTEKGQPLGRAWNALRERCGLHEPRVVPFHERLADFDLIQSWELFTDWSAEGLRAREVFNIPLAVMVWDNIPFNMERNTARHELKRRVATGADRFLVHTERSRRMLDMEGVASSRVVKFSPGLDTERFSPGEAHRRELGVAEDAFVILFVGWLLPRKGIDFLVLALRELLNDPAVKDKYNVQLLAVGGGPGRDRVEHLAARLGVQNACNFTGPLPYDRMPDAFRAADMFVLPSIATPEWQEQFGMSLIEAMACGVPVISTLSGAISEIAVDHAILCQPNDFFSLYESMKRVMLNPALREDLGAGARAYALEQFNLDTYASALSDVYEELLAERG